ncbi:unnamed protein product [Allacma fusca]|uniref:Uncharacterized protein n=1 Tax=Allacma fusca TaxID=39272 RepID=A0A8J2PMN0_9HEXA|nr:unnamed protein product [Allacma fusca]
MRRRITRGTGLDLIKVQLFWEGDRKKIVLKKNGEETSVARDGTVSGGFLGNKSQDLSGMVFCYRDAVTVDFECSWGGSDQILLHMGRYREVFEAAAGSRLYYLLKSPVRLCSL